LVFSTFVVKIPEIKTVRLFKRLFQHLIKGQVQEKLKAFDEQSILKASLKYVFSGIIANKLELSYSKNHKNDGKIIHVSGIFFNLILLQTKAEIMEENGKRWKDFYEFLIDNRVNEKDLLMVKNFGILDNKIKLFDYGNENTIKALDQLNQSNFKFI